MREGEQVRPGQRLARVGSSGVGAICPHLHMHVQNRIELLDPEAISLPLRFSNILANGEVMGIGVPTQGTFVEHRGWADDRS